MNGGTCCCVMHGTLQDSSRCPIHHGEGFTSEASPAPQPEPTPLECSTAEGIEQIRQVMVRQMKAIPIGNYDGWNRYDDDFQHKLHVWANGKSYDIEVPKYPDGAREAIMQSLDPVSQWDAGYEAGKVVGAASERARADAAERDAKVCNLDAERYYKRARELDAEVESLRSELREEREQAGRMNRQWNSALKGEDDALSKCRKLEAQVRDMREALALAVDQASPCECDNNGHCGYCVGAAALLSRKEDKAQ